MADAGSSGLPKGNDIETSFNLEIRIISSSMRSRWYTIDKVVDSDTTNFKDLIDDIWDKYPGRFGDIVKMVYFCADSKSNIEIQSDQDLMNMFTKHSNSKYCCMSIAYHKPNVDPPEIPLWEDDLQIPCTPSMSAPSNVEPSKGTETGTITEPNNDIVEAEDNYLLNPEPENEHVGVDEEGLYIEIAPTSGDPEPEIEHVGHDVEDEDYDPHSSSESGSISDSDTDAEVDEIVTDRLPPHIAQAAYNIDDPPMTVGSIYPNMNEFKLALATHAMKKEFEYNIEVSEPGRYRVYCCAHIDGCKWRLHASKMKDKCSIQVKKNPYPHNCQSTRRSGQVKGATKFWVCEKVKDWIAEDPTIGPSDLQEKLKEKFRVIVPYKRVFDGKNLAIDQLFGEWNTSFDNLYRFKAQIEQSSPGSFVVIDHHTIDNKIRFNRFFFAMKPCVEGFLRACRLYLAVDSTFLTGKFRGQLCIACAVDGHNWIYPVAVGVIDSETNENWIWFMERLKDAIGTPPGLTFSTDCGQAVMTGVSEVFPCAEHRECMYLLVQNFKKRYSGKVFDDHLWLSAYSWNSYMFEKHFKAMAEANPAAIQYLQQNHTKIWTRSQFSTLSKVDYVTNNLVESCNNWLKNDKKLHLDDLMDTIRQKLLIKWNQRKKIALKMEGKILPHIVAKLKEQSYNLDIDVVTSSVDGVAELMARGGSTYRFVVNLKERTCSCRAWQVSGIPCKHAIAFITSIPGEKLEDHVDNYYSVANFRAAYDGQIPSIPDKSMWPKATHGFFMHPPLLKSTAGRRKEKRYKGAAEGGSKEGKGRHKCPICGQYGHHWYTCKDGDPADIAAMLAERGPPKKKKKKTAAANDETSIIVVAPQRMVFPVVPFVADVSKKRKNKTSSSSGALKQKSNSSNPSVRSSGQGSNQLDHLPLSIVYPSGSNEQQAASETTSGQPHKKRTPTRKRRVSTTDKGTPAMATRSKVPSPSSPAMGTRSKKKLNL